MKNVAQLKLDIFRNVAPAKPSDSKDIMGAIQDAADRMLSFIKPKELSKRVIIENALYDQVNQYTCPEDLDTNKIMQWYELKDNKTADRWGRMMTQTTNRTFDNATQHAHGHRNNIFTIEYQSGKKFLKASIKNDNVGLTLNNMDSVTSNGNWNVGGNVVDITTDNLTYVSGNGSVRFNVNTSSNTGYIDNFTMDSVDIEEYLNVGKVFTWIDLPELNELQSVTMNLYSSNSDYYSITVTSPHDTNQFQLGQNLLGFALDQDVMTTVGTPNPKDINHIRLTFVTNATVQMQSVRVDNIVARKGHVYGIQYITKNVFKDINTGETKSRPTQDSDVIMLEYDTYETLLSHCSYVVGRELLSDKNDIVILKKEMEDSIGIYKKRHKEEYIDETQAMRAFGVEYGYYGDGNYRDEDRLPAGAYEYN